MRKSILLLVIALGAFLVTSTAFAQPADDARTQEARAQFANGMRARDGRRWGEAVLAFERSLRQRAHPQTLFEIGNARFRGGDPEGALTALRDMLAMTDPAPSPELQEQARALAREAGEPNLTPTPQRSSTAECPRCPTCPTCQECPSCPPPQVVERTPMVPMILGIAGGVVLGIGAGFYGHALADSAVYNSQNASIPLRMEIKPRGESFRIVGLLGVIAGVGLEATAVALNFVGRGRAPQQTQSSDRATAVRDVRFDIAPDGVVVSGRF
ncbi:MAG: hypothetical protein JNK05_27245 [Myxococcales bacterium]|nr:hypothetical protein [Myxococcales bacterium]